MHTVVELRGGCSSVRCQVIEVNRKWTSDNEDRETDERGEWREGGVGSLGLHSERREPGMARSIL